MTRINGFHQSFSIGIIVIILLAIIFSFCHLFDQVKLKPYDSFLVKINSDSLIFTPEIRMSRNQFLIEQTTQRMAIIEEARSNREDIRIQTRNIYSAILIALLTLIFSKKYDDKNIISFYYIAICFAFIMFYFDVHSVDMIDRITAPNSQHANAFQQLIRIPPTDSTWYSLDYSGIDSVNKVNDEFPEAQKRKLFNSLFPTIEQIIFYLIPIILIAGRLFMSKAKKAT